MYRIKIIAQANYPIARRYEFECSSFSAACGKAIREFMVEEGKINPKRRRKIRNLSVSIYK